MAVADDQERQLMVVGKSDLMSSSANQVTARSESYCTVSHTKTQWLRFVCAQVPAASVAIADDLKRQLMVAGKSDLISLSAEQVATQVGWKALGHTRK